MSDRTIVLGMIAAFAWATPVAAQSAAPTTTAFDGTYVGVSRTLEGGTYQADPATRHSSDIPQSSMYLDEAQCRALNGQPGPLTIAGGVVRWQGRVSSFEGSVNAQGVLVLHDPSGYRIDAQLDSRGTVTGRLTGVCSYQIVWQKEGK
jgi:hypothetical protein